MRGEELERGDPPSIGEAVVTVVLGVLALLVFIIVGAL